METNEFFDQLEKYLNENHVDFTVDNHYNDSRSFCLKFGKVILELIFDYENETIFEYSYSIRFEQKYNDNYNIKASYFQTGDHNFHLDSFKSFETNFVSLVIETSKNFNKSFEEVSAKLNSCRALFRDMGLTFDDFIETEL